MMKISLLYERAFSNAAGISWQTIMPSVSGIEELITMLTLFGRGLPMLSNVFLPIITTLPLVSFLKFFKSSAICHGSLLFLPITLFFAIAAIMFIIQRSQI